MLLWISIEEGPFYLKHCSKLTGGKDYTIQEAACGELQRVSICGSSIATPAKVRRKGIRGIDEQSIRITYNKICNI